MKTPGKIIILTAPSGAGKTSITKYLLKKYNNLCFSISAATRKPRDSEKHGVDYYFLSVDEFQEKIRQNAFAEWEMVYEGKYYGTLKSELERIWAEGKTPVLDIDVQGAIHVQKRYPVNSFSLFIDPPSMEELKRRLSARGSETEDSLQTRLSKASYELSFKHHFNKIVVNEVFQKACEEAEQAILEFLNKPLDELKP